MKHAAMMITDSSSLMDDISMMNTSNIAKRLVDEGKLKQPKADEDARPLLFILPLTCLVC